MANENEGVGDEGVEITGTKKDIWPATVESYFIGLMEEEVKKGNRQTTTLTKAAWRHIKEELKRSFRKEYTPNQFKNKFNQLRGRYKDFSALLKAETGLGYNSSNGQIIATDDQWKKICEKYKFAKQFKKKGCPHYDKLCVIFGDTTASGANQHPSTKSPSISNDDNSEGDNNYDDEEDSHPSKKKTSVSKDVKKRKARENIQLAFANALTNFGETAKKKLEILEKMSTSNVTMPNVAQEQAEQSNNVQDKETLMTCLNVLQELEGIDRASFAKALTLLKEDPLWRDVFLKLSDERKKDWILSLT
ncbi:hypothetical protein RIF29_35615 [Crotalaria pallida]|uniref:Myb/SANT-like domain-containing protein n=1 Tax=Crotalaria pallida TaxID=3830 RepID=A0AAN9EA54_CROPI